jgi:membrane-bound metal-dependent hydrolase YbcI (DUF457 family)
MAGIAHIFFGFASKPLGPKVPLPVWLIGSELIDLLAVALMLAGVERVGEAYWSHSLLMSAAWALAFGLILRIAYRDWKSALLGFGAVISHWILDAIVWPMTTVFPDRPDAIMPFVPGSPAGIGLGLYRSAFATYATEIGLTAIGIAIYVAYRVRRRRPGTLPESSRSTS